MLYSAVQCHTFTYNVILVCFTLVFMYTMSYGDGIGMYNDGGVGTVDFFAYDVER